MQLQGAQARHRLQPPSQASDGLQARCRECNRGWYVKNRTQHIANVKRHNQARQRRMYELLTRHFQTHPCVDCGETDIRCLEFDHVDPSLTVANVSSLLRQKQAWSEILEEINKCVVRCANCHRRRTAVMFQTWRLRTWLDREPDPYEEVIL